MLGARERSIQESLSKETENAAPEETNTVEQMAQGPGLYYMEAMFHEEFITNKTDAKTIREFVHSLDWHIFGFVIVYQSEFQWIEVSGSLLPEDGFSSSYHDGEAHKVINQAPGTVEEMADILITYANDKMSFQERYEFS